jgi:hypothetical protein
MFLLFCFFPSKLLVLFSGNATYIFPEKLKVSKKEKRNQASRGLYLKNVLASCSLQGVLSTRQSADNRSVMGLLMVTRVSSSRN